MFEAIGKYIELSFNEIFKLERGHIISKADIANNRGEYPVYSTQDGIFGYINTYMKEGKYLLWNTDGLAGYIKIAEGRFSYTNIVGIMLPTDTVDFSAISLEYLKAYLEPIFRNHRKGRMGINGKNEYTKLNSTMIKNLDIKIPFPIKEDGSIDLEKQLELAKIYEEIMTRKKELLEKSSILKKVKVIMEDENVTYKEFKISELFIPKNGSSTYTKEWCMRHPGDIPLYSGNTVGAFSYIDRADYDGEYLTWAKDGLAGYLMINKGKFSLTGHRGILIPTNICKNVDLMYLKSIIEPIFRASIKGRVGISGKNEYSTLNSVMIKGIEKTIKIPVKEDGSFDLEKQQELARKTAVIETIKRDLYNQIKELTEVVVS